MASLKNILLDNTANKRKIDADIEIQHFLLYDFLEPHHVPECYAREKNASRMNGRERSRIWTESGVCTKPNW